VRIPAAAKTIREKFAENMIRECIANPDCIIGYAMIFSSYLCLKDLLTVEDFFKSSKNEINEIKNKNIMN